MEGSRADQLHVLVIIDSLTAGGAEMLLADFATGASHAGLRLSVAYLADRDGSPAAARLREAGLEPVRIDYHGLLNPSTLTAVRRHIRGLGPDLVHTHLSYGDAIGGLAARSLGVPSVSTVHLTEWRVDGVRDRVRHHLFNFARRRSAAVVIAVSDASRKAMIESGLERPERIVTIWNGVEAAKRNGAGAAVRAELGIRADEVVVVQVAVLRRGKGHNATIAASLRVFERVPGARLLLVGDGPEREIIERDLLPLGTRALALGHRDDVMAVLDASDVLISPSVADAFPTVLLEAMAAGLPVVATAVGGIPEIVVDDETGLLVSPVDGDQLAAALERVIGDPELRSRLGRAGRERYEAEFTAVDWAKRTRELYDRVLAGPVADGGGGR